MPVAFLHRLAAIIYYTGVKLLYAGVETSFDPSTNGPGSDRKTHLKYRCCAILSYKSCLTPCPVLPRRWCRWCGWLHHVVVPCGCTMWLCMFVRVVAPCGCACLCGWLHHVVAPCGCACLCGWLHRVVVFRGRRVIGACKGKGNCAMWVCVFL